MCVLSVLSDDILASPDIDIMSIQFVVRSDESIRLVQSLGSVLHGVIMECIDPSYAQELHSYSIRPYSQFIFFDHRTKQYIWRISAVTKDAVQNLVKVMYQVPDKLFLKQKQGYLYIVKREIVEATTYKVLMDRFFSSDIEYTGVQFTFTSPTSFKVDGQYTIYPEAFRLYRYWLKRWNTFSSGEKMESDDLSQAIEKSLLVRHYSLHLQRFGLEQVWIPGFKGDFTIQFKGRLIIRQVLSLLSYYGQFTGVGIKTALGMGGIASKLEGSD